MLLPSTANTPDRSVRTARLIVEAVTPGPVLTPPPPPPELPSDFLALVLQADASRTSAIQPATPNRQRDVITRLASLGQGAAGRQPRCICVLRFGMDDAGRFGPTRTSGRPPSPTDQAGQAAGRHEQHEDDRRAVDVVGELGRSDAVLA